jgi:hypothetical protein
MTCAANSAPVLQQHGGKAQRLGRPLPSGVSIAASLLTATATDQTVPTLAATKTGSTTGSATQNGAPTAKAVLAGSGAIGMMAAVAAVVVL